MVTFPAVDYCHPLAGIIFGDRGTCVWTTFRESLHESGMAGNWTHNLLIASPTPLWLCHSPRQLL